LRQLKQRISLRCAINPLKADEVAGYIRARLKVAGASRLDLFTADAVAMIYRAAEGVPRLINNICDNALLTGYALNAKTIDAGIISEVAESLDLLRPMIEDDPREVMAGSMPPLPVMTVQNEVDWGMENKQVDQNLKEYRPSRRRSHVHLRRKDSLREEANRQAETAQFKVVSKQEDRVTDAPEDDAKAG
jgi:hypothetical protein